MTWANKTYKWEPYFRECYILWLVEDFNVSREILDACTMPEQMMRAVLR